MKTNKKSIKKKSATIPWKLDQKIFCLYEGYKYEAKIVEINPNDSQFLYKIHYVGWNARYDEYLNQDEANLRLFEYTQDEADRQKIEKITSKKSTRTLKEGSIRKVANGLTSTNNIAKGRRSTTTNNNIDLPPGIDTFKRLNEQYLLCRKGSRRGKFLYKFWTKANIKINLAKLNKSSSGRTNLKEQNHPIY